MLTFTPLVDTLSFARSSHRVHRLCKYNSTSTVEFISLSSFFLFLLLLLLLLLSSSSPTPKPSSSSSSYSPSPPRFVSFASTFSLLYSLLIALLHLLPSRLVSGLEVVVSLSFAFAYSQSLAEKLLVCTHFLPLSASHFQSRSHCSSFNHPSRSFTNPLDLFSYFSSISSLFFSSPFTHTVLRPLSTCYASPRASGKNLLSPWSLVTSPTPNPPPPPRNKILLKARIMKVLESDQRNFDFLVLFFFF